MAMCKFIALKRTVGSQPDGFSLVELVVAVGVVSIALLSITSLMPVGLATFQKGMQISISEQIIQKVISDAQQTDYATLVDSAHWTGTAPTSFQGPLINTPAFRYFDAQGDELPTKLPDGTIIIPAGFLFQVNTIIAPQAVYYPISGSPVSLPSTVLVKVEVVVNPGNAALQLNTTDNTIKTSATPSLIVYRGVTLVAQSR